MKFEDPVINADVFSFDQVPNTWEDFQRHLELKNLSWIHFEDGRAIEMSMLAHWSRHIEAWAMVAQVFG